MSTITNTKTVPVIFQTVEHDGLPFADWPVDDLAGVFDLIRAWGLVDDKGGQLDVTLACGDLVVHEGRVVFRVSVMDLDS